MDALETGALSEWRADAELFGTLGSDGVGRLGDRQLARRVRATAHLPVVQGVAVPAALLTASAAARSGGDERGQGQVMADTLVERVTGQASAAAVPVEVQLVITDRALFTGALGAESGRHPLADTPAEIPGYGPVPAAWARELLHPPASEDATAATVWLRRLYTHPDDGSLVAMGDGAVRRLTSQGHVELGLEPSVRTKEGCGPDSGHNPPSSAYERRGALRRPSRIPTELTWCRVQPAMAAETGHHLSPVAWRPVERLVQRARHDRRRPRAHLGEPDVAHVRALGARCQTDEVSPGDVPYGDPPVLYRRTVRFPSE
jgi:hypothetical protein